MRHPLALALLLPGSALAAPTLVVGGACPGTVTVDVTGLTPRASYALVTANVTGGLAVPAGQTCGGTALGLGPSGATLRAVSSASGAGTASLAPAVPAQACGLYLQVIDLATCTTSAAVRLPTPDLDYFAGPIDGAQEVPARNSPATGVVEGSLDGNGTFTWTADVTGFSNTLTLAHFHQAPAGVSGPVLHDVIADLSQVGTTVTGGGAWVGAPAATLLAGDVYLNLHSNVFGGGEVRGQVLPVDRFSGVVDGQQEVPANGSGGTGTITGWLDAADVFHWTLSTTVDGALTGAHFHLAAAGTAGPIQQDIAADLAQAGRTVSGSGEWAVPAAQVQDLLDGRIYVNVHTTLVPGGEVRGQLLPL